MKSFGSGLAGRQAADGMAMMFGVHRAEKAGGGFVPGLLPAARQCRNGLLLKRRNIPMARMD